MQRISPSPLEGKGRGGGCKFAALALLALLLLPLAACGKKGPLEPPPGEPNTYPQVYPRE